METIVPYALLGIAVTNLIVAFFRWRAGGKHQVFSTLIMTALALGIVLPWGSGRSEAALWTCFGLIVVAFMTTPGARFRRMRLELALLGAALVVMGIVTLVPVSPGLAIVALVLMAVLFVAGFLVMIRRATTQE